MVAGLVSSGAVVENIPPGREAARLRLATEKVYVMLADEEVRPVSLVRTRDGIIVSDRDGRHRDRAEVLSHGVTQCRRESEFATLLRSQK